MKIIMGNYMKIIIYFGRNEFLLGKVERKYGGWGVYWAKSYFLVKKK